MDDLERPSVAINPRSWDRHTSHVHTGLEDLNALGHIRLQRDARIPLGTRSTMWVRVNGRPCFFDLRDGVVTRGGEDARVYFKRSFRPEMHPQILPYGLYFPCRSRYTSWRHPKRMRRFRTHDHYTIDPLEPAEMRVLFLTRLWESTQAHGRDEESMSRLNGMRAETVRLLRKELGSRFVGGVADTAVAREMAPDLIVDTSPGRYLRDLRRCAIAVTTTGLHESTGAKLAEYLAASRCVLSEPVLNALPDPLVEGWHLHTFTSPEQCVAICAGLLADPAKVSAMRHAGWSYFLHSARPAATLARCIQQALARSDAPVGGSAGQTLANGIEAAGSPA